MKQLKTLALMALLVSGAAQAVGVGMINGWIKVDYTEAQCVQHAAAALKAAGFSQNFEILKTSIYGDQEDYTALVRCVPELKMAYFVVAGPDSDVASHYLDEIDNAF